MQRLYDPKEGRVIPFDTAPPRPIVRLAKLFGSIVFHAMSEAWRTVQRAAGCQPPPTVVAIYYHHVPENQRDRFAGQMDHLLRWARPSASDLSHRLEPSTRYAIVTADDAWLSFAENALPELARRNIPVTIFAVSNPLGSTVDGIVVDRLVKPEELRALRSELVTIGSHGANHKRMTSLDEIEARRELTDSREQLAAIVGSTVKLFSFPYGSYREDLAELAHESGYDRVFTAMPHLARPGDFVVGRVRVDPTDWPFEFHLKLMGAYQWLPAAITLKQYLLHKIRGGKPPPSPLA